MSGRWHSGRGRAGRRPNRHGILLRVHVRRWRVHLHLKLWWPAIQRWRLSWRRGHHRTTMILHLCVVIHWLVVGMLTGPRWRRRRQHEVVSATARSSHRRHRSSAAEMTSRSPRRHHSSGRGRRRESPRYSSRLWLMVHFPGRKVVWRAPTMKSMRRSSSPATHILASSASAG